MKVIAAMMDLSYDDHEPGKTQPSRSRPLEQRLGGPAERFDEFFMAEAFILDDVA